MKNSTNTHSNILLKTYLRVPTMSLVLFSIFLLTAGTWAYWEAHVYIALLTVASLSAITVWFRHNTELLERRTRAGEPEREQRLIRAIGIPIFFLFLLLPGFDRRWDWSQVPLAVVILANALVILGYALLVMAGRANRYLSGVVEVEQDQQVITHGPYAVIRHPMYAGLSLMIVFTPLALGSYWAAIPAVFTIPFLMARIVNEEKVLARDLKGHMQYMQKTKYRLIPGVW